MRGIFLFQGHLLLEPLDEKNWRVASEITYRAADGTEYVIPQGFITDFASVPRALYSIYPRWGRYGLATILHDWLYRWRDLEKPTRAEADALFFEAMAALDVPAPRRWVMWAAVRMFGGLSYQNPRV